MSARGAARAAAVAAAVAAAAVAGGACGGSRPAAPAPAGSDPAAVARRMHASLRELAELARRHRGDCPRLAAGLRELFARMRVVVDEAAAMARDPALAEQLTAELRAYDAADRGLADAIFADLVPCKDDRGVQEAMAAMPVIPAPAQPGARPPA